MSSVRTVTYVGGCSYRVPAAAQHSEYGDHRGPKHAEFVATLRQCPHVTDLKMSAQQHRHQQIHRSEQGHGAGEKSQCEANGGNEFDQSGECNLYGGHIDPQALEIERVDLELKGPAEDVTPEMRHEHQPDIDAFLVCHGNVGYQAFNQCGFPDLFLGRKTVPNLSDVIKQYQSDLSRRETGTFTCASIFV